MNNTKFEFEDIESCECIGNFEDEFVYDLEMEDESHTFIGNDILVHNSDYVTFEPLINSTDLKGTKYENNELQFIIDIYNFRIKDYIKDCLKQFANVRNVENVQNLKLETISKSIIFLKKKKYNKNLVWEENGNIYEDLSNLKSTGIEVIQSSTPTFIRKEFNPILKYFHSTKDIKLEVVVEKLKELKKRYIAEPNIDKKCKNIKLNNYEKYCINDTDSFQFELKCPINVRASMRYNYLLNNSNYKDKYTNIQSGNKVKMYYSKDTECGVFAYLPNYFPKEFAPKFDYDEMFFKVVISPINSFLKALNLQELNAKLEYTKPLF